MNANDIIRRHFSKMGKKGGKKRFQGVPFRDRSEIMKKVRAAGVAKQKAEKEASGGSTD